ncbi:MAG: hypothetical protein EOO75_01055 [Myxococcales bacterium]|nr:MAG: hypothetical protein EOO75_01055 [Myxococcales bacterium]
MRRSLLWILALMVPGSGCGDRHPTPAPAASASARPARLPEDGDADEVVRLIAGLYQPASSVHSAVERGHDCLQRTVGYETLLTCLDRAAQHAQSIARQVPEVASAAGGSCAAAVERAEREVLVQAPAYLTQTLAAVRSKQATLAGPMRTDSLGAWCARKSSACGWLPKAPSESSSPFQGALLANLQQVSCSSQLLQCGEPGATCGVLDVVERLGLSHQIERNKVDGSPASILRVRASQRPIAPLKR